MYESLIGRNHASDRQHCRCCTVTALPQVRRLLATANAEWATQIGQDLDETDLNSRPLDPQTSAPNRRRHRHCCPHRCMVSRSQSEFKR
jgi:hypothetical protein